VLTFVCVLKKLAHELDERSERVRHAAESEKHCAAIQHQSSPAALMNHDAPRKT